MKLTLFTLLLISAWGGQSGGISMVEYQPRCDRCTDRGLYLTYDQCHAMGKAFIESEIFAATKDSKSYLERNLHKSYSCVPAKEIAQ